MRIRVNARAVNMIAFDVTKPEGDIPLRRESFNQEGSVELIWKNREMRRARNREFTARKSLRKTQTITVTQELP